MQCEFDLKEELLKVVSVLESYGATRELAKPFHRITDECQRNRLRIGVLGITSSGKSTFLNALIGRDLLPEQSKATTNLLVYCRRGDLGLDVYYQNGKPAQKFSAGDLDPALVKGFCAEDQNPNNDKGVAGIILSTPEMRLDDRFEVVDTPGLDAHGMDHHDELTLRKFLPEADIVIYITSIVSPLKGADLRVLETIIQHDQRVIFVQSMMDRERDDTQMGVVVESRRQKLRKHMERLRNDVRQHAPRLKSWHQAQVSSKWAKSPVDYEKSGFPSVVDSVVACGQDLGELIVERLAKRTQNLLVDHVRIIDQGIFETNGEKARAERAASERAERRKNLKNCERTIKSLIQDERQQWYDFLSSDGLAAKISNSVSWHLADETFEKRWTEEKQLLESLSPTLVRSLDKAESRCRKALEGAGIPVSRESTPEVTLSGIRPNLSWKWTEEKRRKASWYTWLTLGLIWDQETHRVRRLDKRASRDQLVSFAKRVRASLFNHLNWWLDKRVQTYLTSIAEAIADTRQGDLLLATFSTSDLSDLMRVKGELSQCQRRIATWLGSENHSSSPESEIRFPEEPISRNEGHHVLDRLLRGYRELAFHRQLLRTISSCDRSAGDPVVAAVSTQVDDLRKLIALTRHDLRNWRTTPISSPGVIFHSPSRNPGAIIRANSELTVHVVESRNIWEHLTLVSLLLDKPEECSETLKNVLHEVTTLCLFTNLSQVSHAVKELHDFGFSNMASVLKEKVFFVDLNVHVFDSDRLHEIVTQALPELWERGPYGKRPVLIAENYDCRYTDLGRIGTDLMASSKGLTEVDRRAAARKAVQRWHDEKLSFSPPFTRAVLEEVFGRIASESR